MSGISTHVLDVSNGAPAAGVKIRLERFSEGVWSLVALGDTDFDGRCRELLMGEPQITGVYRLNFDTGAYFAMTNRVTLYPEVAVSFEVTDSGSKYHIPLLLSPFGYTTYRGT